MGGSETLGDVVQRTVKHIVSGQVGKSSIEVLCESGATFDQLFEEAGRVHFEYVVSEFITNAVQSYGWEVGPKKGVYGEDVYVPVGGKVSVRIYEVDAGVRIDIRDEGRGMSPEFLRIKLAGEEATSKPEVKLPKRVKLGGVEIEPRPLFRGGLGIPSSITACDSLGIRYNIESREGVGTIVSLYIDNERSASAKRGEAIRKESEVQTLSETSVALARYAMERGTPDGLCYEVLRRLQDGRELIVRLGCAKQTSDVEMLRKASLEISVCSRDSGQEDFSALEFSLNGVPIVYQVLEGAHRRHLDRRHMSPDDWTKLLDKYEKQKQELLEELPRSEPLPT